MYKIYDLLTEGQTNPVGLSESCPRFSWKIEGEGRAVSQKSYRLQLSTDAGFENLVYESGECESSESVLVRYPGEPLRSLTRYYVRVRSTGTGGAASEWLCGRFTTALLHPENEWRAPFISAEQAPPEEDSSAKQLRGTFTLREKPAEALLSATACGLYELFLNGERVGEDLFTPGWTEYAHRLAYQTYDVASRLNAGENALGAWVGPGWYRGCLAGWLGKRGLYGKRLAFSMQLLVRYADGTEETFQSGPDWKWAPSPVLYSEIYHGERYDARLEQPFSVPGFDGSGWSPVFLLPETPPLCPQDGLPVRRQETLRPVSIFTTPKGERVVDFGQNLTGFVRLHIRGRAGETVAYSHAEALDRDGNFYTANLRSAKEQISYTLRGGEEECYEPHFSFQGFRYIRLDAFPGEPVAENFEAVVVHSAMRPRGRFACSNDKLCQLESNIRWGMKGNFLDIPTDCPQRDERLGWTGDAEVFVPTASYLMDTLPFFRKWLRDMSASQLEDGGIPHVVPDVLTDPKEQNYAACGWGDAAVVCPWTVALFSGDRRILEESYPMMARWVEYIRTHAREGLIWDTGEHFGDWLALDAEEGSYHGATPNALTATAYYAQSVELLAKTARMLGYTEDAAEYERLRAAIGEAYGKEFFTAEGELTAQTQTAHVLSLAFSLTPPQWKEKTLEALERLIHARGDHLSTGFLGTPELLRALGENGRTALGYTLLEQEDYPSWLYPLSKGATTIWEHWDGIKPDGTMWSADMNSFNHYAYGAVGAWMFGTVAGIRPDPEAPGFRHAFLCPQPGGSLTWAEGSLDTPYGLLKSRWERAGSSVRWEVTVPANTTATLELPEGARLLESDLGEEPCEGRMTAGSGVYHLRWE
ncbi:MAG: family 78 glycoside hydrolase catalytic domain [Provencibacterium sp.]|jgi:alpha-L-rhamnosidase|nr:family 78 glycoside hydrolase catalytic domain [Provencibacterium sp.]